MKTLKSVTLALVLFATCSFAKASDVPTENLTKTHAINVYVDVMTRGRISELNQVLDQSAKFSMQRGKSIMRFSKKDMTDYFKNQKNIEQTCTTSTEIIEENDDTTLVKVDMDYGRFTRSNYVTIANTGSGWKITNVYSVFK